MEATSTPTITPAHTSSGGSPGGQRGRLELAFARSGRAGDAKSVLSRRYASSPFGSVRASYPDGSGIPELQVMNPSGGILGGDHLRSEVSLEPGAAATILTQGAAKAYRGAESAAETVFTVGEGAFLEYLPHHLIPYAGSSHRLATEFHLRKDSTLLTWEAFSAGRLARGERFAFDRLSSRTRLFVEGRPEAIDGFELAGGGEPFGGYPYMGTIFVRAPGGGEELSERLHLAVQAENILGSASRPGPSLCVVRVLAPAAGPLYSALNLVRARTRESLGLPPASREVR